MNNKRYFNSFNGLKSIAYVCVFLEHTGFKYLKFGGWGVSLFLIITGFLLTHNYYHTNCLKKCCVKNNFVFAINKIKPLLLLNIICIIFYIPLMYIGDVSYSIIPSLYRIISNVLLIQEWIPLNNSSLNECSWYLSAIFFCYFIFPYVITYLNKQKISHNKTIVCITMLFLIQILLAVTSQCIPIIDGLDLRYWFLYRFPPVRLIDFLIGCLLYLVYVDNKDVALSAFKASFIELLGIILMIFSFVLVCFYIYDNSMLSHVLKDAPYIFHSVIYTLSVCVLIYSFAFEKGIFSKILDNNISKSIVKIGKYGFLIHYVVFDIIRIGIMLYSNLISNDAILLYIPIFKLIFGSLLTYYLSLIWIRIQKYFESKVI